VTPRRALATLTPARAGAGIIVGIAVALVAQVMVEHGDTSLIPLALYLLAIALCLPALLFYPQAPTSRAASVTPPPPTGPTGDRGGREELSGGARPFLPAALVGLAALAACANGIARIHDDLLLNGPQSSDPTGAWLRFAGLLLFAATLLLLPAPGKRPRTGAYAFTVATRGTVDFAIDGRALLRGDVQTDPGPTVLRAPLRLSRGLHRLRLVYTVTDGSPGAMELAWQPPGSIPSIIPPRDLVPAPAPVQGPVGLALGGVVPIVVLLQQTAPSIF